VLAAGAAAHLLGDAVEVHRAGVRLAAGRLHQHVGAVEVGLAPADADAQRVTLGTEAAHRLAVQLAHKAGIITNPPGQERSTAVTLLDMPPGPLLVSLDECRRPPGHHCAATPASSSAVSRCRWAASAPARCRSAVVASSATGRS